MPDFRRGIGDAVLYGLSGGLLIAVVGSNKIREFGMETTLGQTLSVVELEIKASDTGGSVIADRFKGKEDQPSIARLTA